MKKKNIEAAQSKRKIYLRAPQLVESESVLLVAQPFLLE